MKNEFEIISHSRFQHLKVFVVQLRSRTAHIHRDLELGVVLDGSLMIQMGQNKWPVETNELYLINSMQAHELSSDGSGALVLAIQISPKLLLPFLPNASKLYYQTPPPLRQTLASHPEGSRRLLTLCHALAVSYFGKPFNYELDCFRGIATLLHQLHELLPVQFLSQQEYLPIKHRTERVVAITDYIDQHFQRKLLLGEIAEQQGLTITYLSHLFRDILGVSFQEYLKQKRFEYACMHLVNTDQSILDISVESGFSDVRYLTEMFKQRFGCTPRQYRQQERSLPTEKHSSAKSMQYFLSDSEALDRLGLWYEQLGLE